MGINLTSRCSNFKRPNLIRFWYNKRFWFQISNSQAESRRNNSSDHQTNSTGRNTIYRYILQLCVLIYMYIQSFSLIDVNFNCMFYNILIKLIIQRRFLCIFKNKQKSSMFYFKSNYCYLSQEIFYTLTFRLKVFFYWMKLWHLMPNIFRLLMWRHRKWTQWTRPTNVKKPRWITSTVHCKNGP